MNYKITNIQTNEPMFVHIENEGQMIKSTNWWDLPVGKELCFLSFYPGCIRLLVPPAAIDSLPEMHTRVKQIVVSICSHSRSDGYVAEILFDDGSDAPFVIHVCENQVDVLPRNSARRRLRFDVYVNRDGPKRVLTSEATRRFVRRLPCMKAIESDEVTKIELL